MAKAYLKLIVEHIRTSAGARFSTYANEEERRIGLGEYHDECIADGDDEKLPDDFELEDAIDAVEEMEDVSSEEIYVELPKVWVGTLASNEGTHVEVALTRRSAIQWAADQFSIDIEGLDDEAAETLIDERLPDEEYFAVEEKEIQA